ncbi:Uncharacterised protein [Bartonella grahamii]|uniref:Uncharacterized protein n=1 Tax=Bartonella grahamii TaxID=33045 RepID=A0A336NF89_BARGR|nr:hypothetical protein [Bartonella grahamii]SSZ40971.1 Uncharacterised protein [Bartonella grahamii]
MKNVAETAAASSGQALTTAKEAKMTAETASSVAGDAKETALRALADVNDLKQSVDHVKKYS